MPNQNISQEGVEALTVLFKTWFCGNTSSYGVHTYKDSKDGGKEEGKNETVSKPQLDNRQYSDHLQGIQGLGIVPITQENQCKFTVIDIDVYDSDVLKFVYALSKFDIPAVPFLSKSGGLHIYTFYKKYIPVEQAIKNARRIVTTLAIDKFIKDKYDNSRSVEIFPKQKKLTAGSSGSWINLPYYNYATCSTDRRQCALRDSTTLTFFSAMSWIAEQKACEDSAEFNSRMDALPYSDAPPCIQTLYLLGEASEGQRNVYLLQVGTYWKNKDEEMFESHIYDANKELSNPLISSELESTVIQSLRKTSYNYSCNKSPFSEYCNKAICKTRDFGVGKDGGVFSDIEFGQLTQFKLEEPFYEWEVRSASQPNSDFVPLRFVSEDEIINQKKFLSLCMRELHTLPVQLKQTAWFQIVNQSLQNMKIDNMQDVVQVGSKGQLAMALGDFLSSRKQARRALVLNKHVFYDPTLKRFYFILPAFLEYLRQSGMQVKFSTSQLNMYLRDFGVKRMQLDTGRGGNGLISAFSISRDDLVKISGGTVESNESLVETDAVTEPIRESIAEKIKKF